MLGAAWDMITGDCPSPPTPLQGRFQARFQQEPSPNLLPGDLEGRGRLSASGRDVRWFRRQLVAGYLIPWPEKAIQSDVAWSALMTRFHHGTGFFQSATKKTVSVL